MSSRREGYTPREAYTVFEPVDNNRLANLCGSIDTNLRHIEAVCDVIIARRGAHFTVLGENAKKVVQAIELLYARADEPMDPDDMQYELSQVSAPPPSGTFMPPPATPPAPDTPPVMLELRNIRMRPRTRRQLEYLHNIRSNDITFGTGPAGTGKTFLAVACAVNAFEHEEIERIILTRPAVEAGERLGFLPGDLTQKVDPYLRPLYDSLYELMGFERVTKLFERNVIEIAPLAFMRGRTLNRAFIILDEAQNTTPEQMKMFLTRLGNGSRVVVTGDPSQVDLPRGVKSGLIEACSILRTVRGIGFTDFEKTDVVRHPLVARIVDAYERSDPSLIPA